MRMCILACLLLFAALVPRGEAASASLDDQLALAEKAEDVHAQIEILRRILDERPADTVRREQLVRAWVEVGDYDRAEAVLRDWNWAPGGLCAEVAAGVLYERDGRPDEAVALLREARKSLPGDLALTRLLARVLNARQDYAAIAGLLTGAPGVDAQASLVLLRANALRALGRFPESLADFARAAALDPGAAASDRPAYDRLEATLPEISAVSARLQKDPDDLSALLARASLLGSLGIPIPQAAADAEHARRLAPQSTAAAILFARLHPDERIPSVNAAVPPPPIEVVLRLLDCDTAVAAAPGSASALAARAAVLNGTPAQFALALEDANAALAITPSHSAALEEKIFSLVRLHRDSEALAVLDTFEKSSPPRKSLARTFQLLAGSMLESGQLDAAVTLASRGLDAAPTPELRDIRAAAQKRRGRLADSQAGGTRSGNPRHP